MGYKNVLKDLEAGASNHLYLLYGEEQYLVEDVIYRFKARVVDKNFEHFNYKEFYTPDLNIDEFINSCKTLPFMANNRMVVVRDADWFSSNKKMITDSEEKKIFSCIKDLPKSTYLFFILKDKIDRRKKIVKLIETYGKRVEFTRLRGNDIYRWVNTKFGEYGKNIESKTISFFLETTGYLESNSAKRLIDLQNEIKKIANYVGNKKQISQEDVDLLIIQSIENNIFRMLECIGTNKSEKTLRILNEMILTGEPIAKIQYMIIRQFRYLYRVKLMKSQGYTNSIISSKLNIRPFQTRKYVEQAANFDTQMLRDALDRCLDVDKGIKNGHIDARTGIELLVGRFSR